MDGFYKIAKYIASPVVACFYRLKIEGDRKLPEGGAIVVSNHMSNWDVLLLGRVFDRQVHYMAKKELFDNKFVGPIVKGLGAYPVDRGGADMSAIRTSLELLKSGEAIGIFPQGTRVKADDSFEMANGVSMIAIRSHADVIPVHINGPYKLFHRVTICVGEPFKPCAEGERINKNLLEQTSVLISERVMALKKR